MTAPTLGASRMRLWTPSDDPLRRLLIPVLSHQTHIVRMVGYFSSGWLTVTRPGWSRFVAAGGRMLVLCSERLHSSDTAALRNPSPVDAGSMLAAAEQVRRLKGPALLSYLIGLGTLRIRLVAPSDGGRGRLFHAKTGAATGQLGPVVWVGSPNDTRAGWTGSNYEHVLSVAGPGVRPLAEQVIDEFDRIWTGRVPGYKVRDP